MHKCFLAFERNFQTHRLRSALVLCLKPTPRVIMKDLKCFGRDGSCLGAFLCLRSSMVSGTYNCTILAPLSPVTTTRLYKTKQSHKIWLHILGPVINIQEPPLFYFNTRSVLPLHIERGITRVFFLYLQSRWRRKNVRALTELPSKSCHEWDWSPAVEIIGQQPTSPVLEGPTVYSRGLRIRILAIRKQKTHIKSMQMINR